MVKAVARGPPFGPEAFSPAMSEGVINIQNPGYRTGIGCRLWWRTFAQNSTSLAEFLE